MKVYQVLYVLWFVSLTWRITFIAGEDGCKDMFYLDCIQNKTLTGYIIKTSRIPVPALVMCQNQCFEEDQCVSYNLGPVDGAIRTCELNGADHWMRPGFLVAKEGFEYCPIENPCSSSPCPADRLCTPNFDWDTYSCDDGGWTSWSVWSGCFPSCPRVRKRTCTNPPPRNEGTGCRGIDQETEQCQNISHAILAGCNGALGMENRRINDSQITSSSIFNNKYKAFHGRLNNIKTNNHYGCWGSKTNKANEWLQVDLINETIVTGVATQGSARAIFNEWVTEYAVSFSNDAKIWSTGECVKRYNGNSNKESVVYNTLTKPIKARYIRFIVKTFNGWPTMRVELYGCSP